ncbi:MAG: primosomal protein N' [Clostridia bacterium]|nr:primosomal protein N' [Clostridia bacterium]
MIASVIVDIAHSEVDKIFDYDCRRENVSVGSRVVVPFGRSKIDGVVIELKETTTVAADKLRSIIRVIDDEPAITLEGLSLMRFMAGKYHLPKAAVLRLFLPTEMRKGKVRERLVTFVTLNDNIDAYAVRAGIKKNAKAQAGVLDFVIKSGDTRISELRAKFSPSAVNKFVQEGVFLTYEKRENRSPYESLISEKKEFEFTNEQDNAVSTILNTKKTVTLIHGVTGSGKTAVYLDLISRAVREGKSAIMLVPEISLTPQMLSQLRATFGEACAILHSGLSAGEKFDEWWRLRSKEAVVAIGARSAIFAPVENLGVIIIDEEHDGSYVSESSPRYNTFDIAKFRAEFNGAKLVLGSATPSVETYLAAKKGEFELVRMKNRINGKNLPEMIVADMRKEVRKGNNSAFSSALSEELQKCLASGNQAIIFLNRRGYSHHVICRECGYVAKCENCDVALNYHSVGNLLKCHYCGATYKMLSACPECGGIHINYVGTGTQKVVEDIKKAFPSARVLRMDVDTTSNKEGHLKILKAFSEKQADILVGTQMIAKGHDFPSVTLVGILDADMSLFFSDFRSGERTYQLITQVAGRSGRAEDKGVVVLQTYNPDNAVLQYAINYDYEGFFERECSIRKATFFPPFSTIVRVMIEGENEEKSVDTLRGVFVKLKELYEEKRDAFLFFNKMKSPIKRLKNKYRYQVLMRLKAGRDDVLDEIYSRSLPYSDKNVLVYVEINASNLS